MIEANDVFLDEEIWGREAAGPSETAPTEPSGPVTVQHVVDYYRRYPGEVVTFYTRIDVHEDTSDLTLRITLPKQVALGDYRALTDPNQPMPFTEVTEGANYLVWTLAGDLPAGARHEYMAQARIGPLRWDTSLQSQAIIYSRQQEILAQETVSIAIYAKGNYLIYLPSIYEQDELMGRFLMLFESFLTPIEQQVDNIQDYFDPRITPAAFLPWLASWLDLELDKRWPEARQRRLIRWAIALHRSRGTKWGLLKYLEIYTGQKAEIIERRAVNFVLGKGARLGHGIALGRSNQPHTFSVTLRLPPVEAGSEQEKNRQEKLRRRTIESIIDRQKPAHTVYTLHLEPITPAETDNQAAPRPTTPPTDDDELAAQAAIWFKLDDEAGDTRPDTTDRPNGKKGKAKRRGNKQ